MTTEETIHEQERRQLYRAVLVAASKAGATNANVPASEEELTEPRRWADAALKQYDTLFPDAYA